MTRMRLGDLPERINEVSGEIVDGAIEVHRALGPGLLESAYQRCLVHELRLRGLQVSQSVPIEIDYKGLLVREAYFADLFVEGSVVVELKTATTWGPIDEPQLYTYMRALRAPLGILLNFHVPKIMENGFIRRAMSHAPSPNALRASASGT